MWAIHPEAIALLARGGRSVRLTAADLGALQDCLQGRASVTSLPRDLFRELFESGLLTPAPMAAPSASGAWIPRLPALALSPDLGLTLQFRSGSARLSGMEPSIGLFLDPELVQAASQLSRRFRGVLRQAAHDCAVRGMPFPRERVDRLLLEIALGWRESHPRSRTWLEGSREEGGVRWQLRDPQRLERKVPAFPDCILTARIRKRSRQVQIPIGLLPALGEILDVLRGGDLSPTATAALENPAIGLVLGLIEGIGGLIPASAAPPAIPRDLPSGMALSAMHLGHAHVMVDSERHRILFDPLLHPWEAAFERQPPTSRQLGPVDAIFFTHHHEDHFQTDSLLTLPRNVPVYIPPEAQGIFRPRLHSFLKVLGYRDVRPLPAGARVTFDDGLEVEAVPFHGESSGTLGWTASCYLVSRAGRNVLLHADASPDRSGRSLLSTGELRQLVGRRGPIEAVWGTWWQERTFAVELGAQAVFALPPSRWLEEAETCDCPSEYLSDLVRVTKATEFLFYAESGEELFLPERRRSDYLPTVSLLWRSREEVSRRLRDETGVRVTTATPYGRLLVPAEGPLTFLSWSPGRFPLR